MSLYPRQTYVHRLGLLAAAAIIVVASAACAGEQPPKRKLSLPAREQLHLYLLIGQSNMVGRAELSDEDKQTHPRIIAINRDNVWAPACNPLPHTDTFSQGVGPGMTFARALIEQDKSITIGLIPCAQGASVLNQWVKGAELYKKAIQRTRAAQKDGVLKGILWHQGESETGSAQLAGSYLQRATRMLKDLRKDLGAPDVPIVVGEIGHYFYDQRSHPYARAVNEALGQVRRRITNAGLVTAERLQHKGDDTHLDTRSQRELGKRYARQMLRLQRQRQSEKAKGQPVQGTNKP